MAFQKIYIRRDDTSRATLQGVTLDGFRLRLRFQWVNPSWMMWVHDIDDTLIFGPQPVVGGLDLFRGRRHDTRIPPGKLFVYSKDREDPTVETVDKSAILVYEEAA